MGRLNNTFYETNQMLQRIYRLPDVKAVTGLSRSTIYANIATGQFPPPLKLGARSSGWLESEIDAWLTQRANARKPPVSSGGFNA